MTLVRQISDQMNQKPARSAATMRAVDGGLVLDLRVVDWDRLGCLMEHLELRRAQGGLPEIDPSWIADRVTYLGETLRVVELDEGIGCAVLRSAEPRRQGDGISFYEVRLSRQGTISLCRRAYSRRLGQRTAIPAAMTRETLERLIVDLIEAARGD